MCAFGCGGAHEGESGAAKRLFRDVEAVGVGEGDADADAGWKSKKRRMRGDGVGVGGEGYCLVAERFDECGSGSGSGGSSSSCSGGGGGAWAGRRMVTDWNCFLRSCEREGVARV